ncbi:MAG TPA: tRNA (adenosine(37)-N6)-threonylcarbamoyltransferase complex dimerization subunit type 1 TsaB [Anaerolineae bacterium]|nr:tRNA (adenosine(37)-N6)-threonylcarbamoyltransferase complex dimerization subunit type 1 TsaB [Anaerolineae bacterium]
MILAIDTATRWLGLALHDGHQVLAEVGWRSFNRQTAELAPAVNQLMSRADLPLTALTGLAVAIGPGSYTGLRVSLGFAKGFALANKLPIVGVPTLDIVASSMSGMSGQLVVVAEAGRTRVCAAFYKWQRGRGWQKNSRPIIESWDNLLANLEPPAIFAGEISPEAAAQIRNHHREFRLVPAAATVRRAGYLAEIGWLRLQKGQADDPLTLVPIYLRDPAGRDTSATTA